MDKIEQFYDGATQREWERLDRHRMEFATTRRALAEHLLYVVRKPVQRA